MKNIRILIIDDEQGVLNAVKDILQDYTVISEINPLNALEKVKTGFFDIFIVDYQMPVANGIEILEEINQVYDKNRPSVRILATAAGTTYLFENEHKRNLFTYFLEKPIDAGKLTSLIQKSITFLKLKKLVILC